MSTMWDIREMMNRVYPNTTTYKRPQPKDGAAQKIITQGTNIFERDFLGAMYVLGTTAPDTMVKSRDAMIVADQLLYPSDSTEPTSPGKNRAMIEQIFAAHELGVNALEVNGGKATISTQVTLFAGDQTTPAVDLDFELRTTDGRVLATSAGATAAEHVSSSVQPNTRYILRVKGFANGPSTFNIVSDQLLPNNSPNANAGGTKKERKLRLNAQNYKQARLLTY